MKLLLLISLIALGCCQISCTSNEFYIKQIRVTSSWGYEESHVFYEGSTAKYTCPTLVASETRTIEGCVTKSSDNKYTLKLTDTYGDSWTLGSYIRIYNEYDGMIFNGFLSTPREEVFENVILFTPVKKNQSWKFANGVTDSSWNTLGFGDSSWTAVTLPEPSSTTTGTQYFRYKFNGIASAAAFEVNMKYKFGILAHINGVEMYRDQMDSGTVTKDTSATGSYSDYGYHGFIRSGNYIANGENQNVLAVELHFLSAITTINFDAWLAVYGNSARGSDMNCHVIGIETSQILASSTTVSPTLVYDLGKGTSWYQGSISTSAPAWISLVMQNKQVQFNGFQIWPYSYGSASPHTFSIQGAVSESSTATFTTLANGAAIPFVNNEYKYGVFPFNTNLYRQYKILATQAWGATMYIAELNPMVCGVAVPTSLSFLPTTTKYHRLLETLRISVTVFGVTGCSVSPSLPGGVSLNADTCVISGTATEVKSMTTYTITATNPALSGTIAFEIVSCEGTSSPIEIYRYYGYSSAYESFKILSETGSVLVEEASSTVQVDNTGVTRGYCLSGTRFQISCASSTLTYWNYNSYIQVRNILDDERDVVIHHRMDNNVNLNPVMKFSMYRPILPFATWKYKHDYSDNAWFSVDTSSWSGGTKGNFGTPTSKYQVYRMTFSVSSDELAKSAHFVLSARYQYGMIVYLNGVEIYRNNLGDGPLSTVSTVSYYSTVGYREISLPVRTMKIGDQDAQQILKSGSNDIGIALVAQTASQTTVVFDASIRCGTEENDRSFEATFASLNVYNPNYIFTKSYSYHAYYSTCNVENYVTITFNDDRREWVSAVNMIGYYYNAVDNARTFKLEAKNAADSAWISMSNQTNWTWWGAGQHKKFYIMNNKPYNMWRFSNFGTMSTTLCTWRVHAAVFLATKTDVTISPLSYQTPYSGYRNVEMAELWPSTGADYRSNFRVSPTMPTGMYIDPPSGVLLGKPTVMSSRQSYTISADSVTGEVATFNIELEVVNCDNGKSLITMGLRTDSNPSYISYKLYEGKTTSGNIITERASMPTTSTTYWIDRCLPHKFYNFFFKTTLTQGTYFPSGAWLSIDFEQIPLNFQVIGSVAPTERSMVFTSQLPFEVEFTNWRVYMIGDPIAAEWKNVDYNDSTWDLKKAMDVTTSPVITMYYRATFNIEGEVSDFQTLSGHCKYTGGLIGYFNGQRVVRFNIGENPGQFETSKKQHSASMFSKFAFPVQLKGIVSGKNVMAFEHHRFQDHSSSSEHSFDCTGAFGVEEVNIISHGFEAWQASQTAVSFDYPQLLDGRMDTYCVVPNVADFNIQFQTFNMERSQFNAYMFITGYAYTGYTFGLDGKFTDDPKEPWEEDIAVNSAVALLERGRLIFDCPVCMAGFRYYLWHLDAIGTSNLYLQQFALVYKKATGAICPPNGDYPAVGEGQISPSVCVYGYTGYTYRKCQGGSLGEVQTDKCRHKAPEGLAYDRSNYDLVLDTIVNIPAPTYTNVITSFMIEGGFLPPGLVLNAETGAVTGVPTQVTAQELKLNVYGQNPVAATMTELRLSVRIGRCPRTAEFPQTEVDKTAVYDCSTKGSYIGELKAKCNLGERDGEWGKSSGMCTPTLVILFIVIVAILLVIVIVLVVVRSSRRKPSGGVKKSSKKAGGASKKASNKAAVKV